MPIRCMVILGLIVVLALALPLATLIVLSLLVPGTIVHILLAHLLSFSLNLALGALVHALLARLLSFSIDLTLGTPVHPLLAHPSLCSLEFTLGALVHPLLAHLSLFNLELVTTALWFRRTAPELPPPSSNSSSTSTRSSSSRTHTPVYIPPLNANVPPSGLQNSWQDWATWDANNQPPTCHIPFIAPSASPMVGPGSWNFNSNSNNNNNNNHSVPFCAFPGSAPYIPYAAPQDPRIPPVNSSWGWGAPIPQHPRFFFEDGNVTINLENTLYKLHRYLFKKSSWNFDINTYPAHLWASSKKDLDRFLTILYPSDYSKHECETAEEWASVLTVANNVGMEDIRRLAISRLADVAGPVDKIVLGHKFNINEWLAPAYLALAMRTESVTPAEGAKLGVDALVRLAALQDEVYQNLRSYISPKKFTEMFESKLRI
ncbi:hypothetical protein C8R45DRAFT_926141 [Mycena sanguinolenta]|nr:hypothetical protein C8R45DRAFT_926141 [Mycena sanguinolenta]